MTTKQSTRLTGTVAWFNNDKGFGFIHRDDGAKDVFVHYTGITPERGQGRRDLFDGDAVEFEIITGPKGKLQAVNVAKPASSGRVA